MTKEDIKAKYKDDKELINFIDEQEKKINTNYLEDNIKLIKENEKLKSDNLLLYNQVLNGKGAKEESTDAPFKDYTEDIIKDLKNR